MPRTPGLLFEKSGYYLSYLADTAKKALRNSSEPSLIGSQEQETTTLINTILNFIKEKGNSESSINDANSRKLELFTDLLEAYKQDYALEKLFLLFRQYKNLPESIISADNLKIIPSSMNQLLFLKISKTIPIELLTIDPNDELEKKHLELLTQLILFFLHPLEDQHEFYIKLIEVLLENSEEIWLKDFFIKSNYHSLPSEALIDIFLTLSSIKLTVSSTKNAELPDKIYALIHGFHTINKDPQFQNILIEPIYSESLLNNERQQLYTYYKNLINNENVQLNSNTERLRLLLKLIANRNITFIPLQDKLEAPLPENTVEEQPIEASKPISLTSESHAIYKGDNSEQHEDKTSIITYANTPSSDRKNNIAMSIDTQEPQKKVIKDPLLYPFLSTSEAPEESKNTYSPSTDFKTYKDILPKKFEAFEEHREKIAHLRNDVSTSPPLPNGFFTRLSLSILPKKKLLAQLKEDTHAKPASYEDAITHLIDQLSNKHWYQLFSIGIIFWSSFSKATLFETIKEDLRHTLYKEMLNKIEPLENELTRRFKSKIDKGINIDNLSTTIAERFTTYEKNVVALPVQCNTCFWRVAFVTASIENNNTEVPRNIPQIR